MTLNDYIPVVSDEMNETVEQVIREVVLSDGGNSTWFCEEIDNTDRTPLHYAATGNKNVDVTKCLMSCEADVNAKDSDDIASSLYIKGLWNLIKSQTTHYDSVLKFLFCNSLRAIFPVKNEQNIDNVNAKLCEKLDEVRKTEAKTVSVELDNLKRELELRGVIISSRIIENLPVLAVTKEQEPDTEWLLRQQELIDVNDCDLYPSRLRTPDFPLTRRQHQLEKQYPSRRAVLSIGCSIGGGLIHMGYGKSDTLDSHNSQAFPVEVVNDQDHIAIHEEKIKFICGKIIYDAGFRTGRLGVVLTDNVAIQALNHSFLGRDDVTDVICFSLECTDSHFEVEMVVNAEWAKERCGEFGWDDESELMLYVIHGALHLVGYDDQTEDDTQFMRKMEADYLRFLGIIVNSEL